MGAADEAGAPAASGDARDNDQRERAVDGGKYTTAATADVERAFLEALAEHGLQPVDGTMIVADGRLHKFHVDGDRRGNKSGWAVLHADGIPAGVAESFRTGARVTWCARRERDLTDDEQRAMHARIEAARAERDRRRQADAQRAVERARRIYESAGPASPDHPYLKAKGIEPPPAIRQSGNRLVVPLYRAPGTGLVGLQVIDAAHEKRYLSGTMMHGAACPVSTGDRTAPLVIAEGVATAASIAAATGYQVIAAMTAGNLDRIAREMRDKYAERDIIIGGDNDESGTGQRAARQAAEAVAGPVAIPQKPGDWNDVHAADGLEAVRQGIEAALHSPDPVDQADEGPLHINPKAPYETALQLVNRHYMTDGMRRLLYWQSDFRERDAVSGPAYREISEDDMRARIYRMLADTLDYQTAMPVQPTARRVSELLDALKAVAKVDDGIVPPTWLDGRDGPSPTDLVPVRNGILHLPSRELMKPTPALFTLAGLPFDYDPNAPEPSAWLEFLERLWPDDGESIRALRQWFGLLLSADTSQQKILLVVGPPRSGKGTIGRILRELIGPANVAAPTLNDLAREFGLSNLIGKLAAIVSDARLSGKSDITTIGERLLSISGEDAISIPRKFLEPFTAQLAARFVILTNELPPVADASGALAGRFIIISMKRSWLGREDRTLMSRLLPELPGILNWAIDGWQDLQRSGHLLQPASATAQVEELAEMASPVSAFVREECSVGAGLEVECDRLFGAWKDWCDSKGRSHPGTEQSFGKQLHAALPYISTARPTIDGKRTRVHRGIALLR